MTTYAHYDAETHRVLGFYDSRIHATIPEPHLAVEQAAALAVSAAARAHEIDPATGAMTPMSPAAPTKPELHARLERLRLTREGSGVDVAGVIVLTDVRAMTLINGAISHAAFPIKLKTASGDFVDVDKPALEAVAGTVAAHVSAGFAAEADVAALIDAGAVADFAALDAAWAATG